jgi:hypothetical protein
MIELREREGIALIDLVTADLRTFLSRRLRSRPRRPGGPPPRRRRHARRAAGSVKTVKTAICRFRISEVLSVTALQLDEMIWGFVLLTVVIVEWP